ncbi:hypothetical protein CPB83DRAFT_795622 [Crepidotus variabilis]|uniref:Uncharacterized protein n=1 Tax=Crepidotus variabilis TaxID=179855 RepID=A0A9P6EBK9_9AGAR|nr:hypothetical protein CPB83DRAFT_795622 [Crepidotus variabilis]
MYCLKGPTGKDDRNTNSAVLPMSKMTKSQWWFQHWTGCDQFPPDAGVFLDLPARGNFTVEHAVNRVFTTTVDNPTLGVYVDGQNHPALGTSSDGKSGGSDCITNPNIHTQNETMAAGTAFAISYTSDLSQVTAENLVVFSVLYNTPWRRIAVYKVPDLPACPAGGCICAWGWVANGCGMANMYMQGFRCQVTNASGSAKPLAPAKPPVWCESNPGSCRTGAKQMIYWSQTDGNNIEVSGYDLSGSPKSPGYNMKLGFHNGAQTDIFN